MFVVGWDSSIETEELALASFSACWAGELVFSTWGAVLRREQHCQATHRNKAPAGGQSRPRVGLSTRRVRDSACRRASKE